MQLEAWFLASRLHAGCAFAAAFLLIAASMIWPASGVGQPQCHGTRELRGLHDKRALAAARGIPDPWNYELDHYIPLCLGGSDDVGSGNLRFQNWTDAIRKDADEAMACIAVCHGTLTQQEAIDLLHRLWPEDGLPRR
jgi:hypothetical protein